MPHKHTRRDKDESIFDLPPSQIAKPLPPTISSKKKAEQKTTDDGPKKSTQKRKRSGTETDGAPRAFKRLMAFANGRKPRDGLDNGDAPEKGKGKGKKKQKKGTTGGDKATTTAKANTTPKSTAPPPPPPTSESTPAPPQPAQQDLKIRPGERLSEFAQRVDAALPLAGLVNKPTVKNGRDPLGIKVRRTKKERKMHNMYAEWREMDRKVQERREEERELAEERELEDEAMGVSWRLPELESGGGGGVGGKKGKKKGGKKGGMKYIGEAGGPERDPWEEIRKKRGEVKVGIHDVAQAPPELKLPRKNLLVRGATVAVDEIPKAAGSLRQREELQGIRQEVVASYRKMMSERRPAVGT